MNAFDHIPALTAIGLTEKQAKLYLAGLQLGTSPASRIAALAGVNRATAYQQLEEMVPLGFIIASDRSGTRHYTVLPPRKLPEILEQRRIVLAQTHERLLNAVVEMEQCVRYAFAEPMVRCYEGRVGLVDLHRKALRSKGLIRSWDLSSELDEGLERFLREEFVPGRMKRGIFARVIANEGTGPTASDLREVRVLPNATMNVLIKVFDDTTIISSHAPAELFGVEIESPYVAQAIGGIFDTLWAMLPAAEQLSAPKTTTHKEKAKKS